MFAFKSKPISIVVREGKMINIAIVEDEKVASDLIYDYLLNYGKKSGEEFNVTVFKDPLALLENYKPTYDLIFMDIMMPNMDGMQASHKLRELDSSVLLIFITNMGDYAVKGYDVGASAFIKKPLLWLWSGADGWIPWNPSIIAIAPWSSERGAVQFRFRAENEPCYLYHKKP